MVRDDGDAKKDEDICVRAGQTGVGPMDGLPKVALAKYVIAEGAMSRAKCEQYNERRRRICLLGLAATLTGRHLDLSEFSSPTVMHEVQLDVFG